MSGIEYPKGRDRHMDLNYKVVGANQESTVWLKKEPINGFLDTPMRFCKSTIDQNSGFLLESLNFVSRNWLTEPINPTGNIHTPVQLGLRRKDFGTAMARVPADQDT
jgi:hypothetical protein